MLLKFILIWPWLLFLFFFYLIQYLITAHGRYFGKGYSMSPTITSQFIFSVMNLFLPNSNFCLHIIDFSLKTLFDFLYFCKFSFPIIRDQTLHHFLVFSVSHSEQGRKSCQLFCRHWPPHTILSRNLSWYVWFIAIGPLLPWALFLFKLDHTAGLKCPTFFHS